MGDFARGSFGFYMNSVGPGRHNNWSLPAKVIINLSTVVVKKHAWQFSVPIPQNMFPGEFSNTPTVLEIGLFFMCACMRQMQHPICCTRQKRQMQQKDKYQSHAKRKVGGLAEWLNHGWTSWPAVLWSAWGVKQGGGGPSLLSRPPLLGQCLCRPAATYDDIGGNWQRGFRGSTWVHTPPMPHPSARAVSEAVAMADGNNNDGNASTCAGNNIQDVLAFICTVVT